MIYKEDGWFKYQVGDKHDPGCIQTHEVCDSCGQVMEELELASFTISGTPNSIEAYVCEHCGEEVEWQDCL